MQRYFVNNNQINQELVIISDGDFHHMIRVMRMAVGDVCIICNQDAESFQAVIRSIGTDTVDLEIMQPLYDQSEIPAALTLIHGLPKGDKLELIVQKTTELGVETIIPWAANRSIVKLDDKKAEKKVQRWQAIAKEAAEQSHRLHIPHVSSPQTTKQILAQLARFDIVFVAYEIDAHEQKVMQDWTQKVMPGMQAAIIIGPEGGITEHEYQQFIEYGAISVQLGKRILRTETAAIYSISVLGYSLEAKERE